MTVTTPHLPARAARASRAGAPAARPPPPARRLAVCAAGPGGGSEPESPVKGVPRPPPALRRKGGQKSGEPPAVAAPPSPATLPPAPTVNPVELGRRSRAFVDNVWSKVLALGSTRASGSSLADSDAFEAERFDGTPPPGEETTAVAGVARFHTVLVAGATGRVGAVLVRKLALRGYQVRALVRSPEAAAQLPSSVEVAVGDLGDSGVVAAALQGVTKVVMCAAARTTLTADLSNVDRTGMNNLIRGMLDGANASNRAAVAAEAASAEGAPPLQPKFTLVKFQADGGTGAAMGWGPDDSVPGSGGAMAGLGRMVKASGARSDVGRTLEGEMRWSGLVLARGDAAVSTTLAGAMPAGRSLGDADGLVLRCRGDGKRYSLLLACRPASGSDEDADLIWYAASFATRVTWGPIRLPFSAFRPLSPGAPPLAPATAMKLGFRFEARNQPKRSDAGDASGGRAAAASEAMDSNSFNLEIAFIKGLPSGAEPDFVLVSCAGVGLGAEDAERVGASKRSAEALLRNSGLGYTIVRPGALRDEPGGAKALLFDQGGRITEGIACADVADVCLRALHDGEARNTSFDVCHEYAPEGGGRYELVAHVPDRNNNYLTPALAVLEKQT